MDMQSIISLIVQILYVATIIGLVTVIVSENRNPQKTITWVLVLTFLPILGLILYLFFGENHRREWSVNRRMTKGLEGKDIPHFNLFEEESADDTYRKLKKLLKTVGHAPVLDGNHIDFYSTGKDKFEQLFADIEQAKSHVHLLYYAIISDETGNRLKELLIRKVKEGVEVRIIYDDVGSLKARSGFFKEMEKAGIKVDCFLPIRFPYIARRVNYRNHRKIAVIDGEIGYIGGMNIADPYVKGLKWGVWRDLTIRIRGKAVYALQVIFLMDWYYSHKEALENPAYFPPVADLGNNPVQIVTSGPMDTYEALTEGFFQAISNAQQYIYIQTPYFMPSDHIVKAMQMAALSGVEVRLMIPRRSDNFLVGAASRSFIRSLLESNVKVYLYTAGFLHSKLIVVDDSLAIIGSANMDTRSFELNFEDCAFIYNKETAQKAKEIFYADMQDACEVDIEKWMKRARWKHYFESLMRLMTPVF
ncbi:cardiolipin synthase [Parabacteroides sp. OttesenSCG-928-K15]|nr:cardiolipin synthase [Parabacteroides sp. OttesenSCG-928-K15]